MSLCIKLFSTRSMDQSWWAGRYQLDVFNLLLSKSQQVSNSGSWGPHLREQEKLCSWHISLRPLHSLALRWCARLFFMITIHEIRPRVNIVSWYNHSIIAMKLSSQVLLIDSIITCIKGAPVDIEPRVTFLDKYHRASFPYTARSTRRNVQANGRK